MAAAAFRPEEQIGLAAAVVLHGLLVAALLFQPDPADAPPLPERVTVSLAEDVGLEAAAPRPVPESRAAIAPILSDRPVPPDISAPEPAPRPAATTAPRPRATPPPRQTRREPPRRRPDRPARTTPRPTPTQASGSRIGADFLPGAGDSADTSETRAPARAFGARERAALAQAITRQLRPHWRAPQGVDTDKIVTILTWRMNADGSLAGAPRVVRQSGINDANRAQARVHAERAIRAVQLAAPFNLPDDFYDRWKYIRDWRFDRRL